MIFEFERRAVRNTIAARPVPWDGIVPEECKTQGLGGRVSSFNEDYMVLFVDQETLAQGHKSAVASLLPDVVGADVFVTTDPVTKKIVLINLLGGEVFPPRQYRQYLSKLAVALAGLECPLDVEVPLYPGLSLATPVSWRKLITWPVVYAWVIHGELCFFLGERQVWAARDAGAQRLDLRFEDDSHFVAHIDSGRIAAIEGWMRVPVFESEWKLMAVVDE